MVKHYNTTFNYLGSTITVSASVTDRQEDRNRWKPVFAADLMTQWLRQYGIFNIRCIHAKNLQEVAKKEIIKWSDTVQQMQEAEARFKAMENSTDKLVMAMYADRDRVRG